MFWLKTILGILKMTAGRAMFVYKLTLSESPATNKWRLTIQHKENQLKPLKNWIKRCSLIFTTYLFLWDKCNRRGWSILCGIFKCWGKVGVGFVIDFLWRTRCLFAIYTLYSNSQQKILPLTIQETIYNLQNVQDPLFTPFIKLDFSGF